MMKISNLSIKVYLIGIVIITLNIILVFSLKNSKKITYLYKQKLSSVIKSNNFSKKAFINRENTIIKNIGLQINLAQPVSNEKNKVNNFAYLLNNQTKIIFRYSELNCALCIEAEIKIISKYYNNIGLKNIIFLSSYKTTRDLFLFKRMNQLQKFTIYNLKEGKLNIPIDSLNIPYVFLVDSSGKIVMINIPERTLPELSDQFYIVAISRFFSNFYKISKSK